MGRGESDGKTSAAGKGRGQEEKEAEGAGLGLVLLAPCTDSLLHLAFRAGGTHSRFGDETNLERTPTFRIFNR